mgnify:CR=1 FL=1
MRNHRRRTDEFIRPRYMLWENVPGAFSSGETHGADFHTVLEEVCRIKEADVSIPGPPEGHGLLPGLLWEKDSLLLGEYWTLNFGVSPREEIASSLSQILEDTVPVKYYLSPTACGGIIRRSEKRGKVLPAILKQALLMQAGQVPEKTM